MPAEQQILWDDSVALTASPVTRNITWKTPRNRILIDIRTDAANDAQISVVMKPRMSTTTDRTLLQPEYSITIPFNQMNSVYELITPFKMRSLSVTAYSPTLARLFFMYMDYDSKEHLGL